MKKIIFFVTAFAVVGIMTSLSATCSQNEITECPECSPRCSQCSKCYSECCPECCSEGVCDCEEPRVSPQQMTLDEQEQVRAMYEKMQEAYMQMNVHPMIEKAFQDIIDCHPEAAEIAKKYYGVDLEQGIRALATPVYYINY